MQGLLFKPFPAPIFIEVVANFYSGCKRESAFWSVMHTCRPDATKVCIFTHLSSVCMVAPVDQMGELLIVDLWKIHETREAR